jgi:hypothetical protein
MGRTNAVMAKPVMIPILHELPPETRRRCITAPDWSMDSPFRAKVIMMHGLRREKAEAQEMHK